MERPVVTVRDILHQILNTWITRKFEYEII